MYERHLPFKITKIFDEEINSHNFHAKFTYVQLKKISLSMDFKYQSLFDEFNIHDCPPAECVEINMEAYRWSHFPITHEWNFLPNLLYNKITNQGPPRQNTKSGLCSMANLSFFTSASVAKSKLDSYRLYLEAKHQKLVDRYTHICYGSIEQKDGVASEIKHDHFVFYEYINCNFAKKFRILEDQQ